MSDVHASRARRLADRLRGAVRLLAATALLASLCLLLAEPRAAGALVQGLAVHLTGS